MNLYLRLLRVFILAFAGPPIDPFGVATLRLRTWPQDVDVRRANNGRYVTVMDLGRVAFVCRAGFAPVLARRRWYPMVAGLTIRYRRSLAVFEPFELRTRILSWDDRFFYFEQSFVQDGETAAVALVRAVVRGPRGTVPPAEVCRARGLAIEPPPCPEHLALWLRADAAIAQAAA